MRMFAVVAVMVFTLWADISLAQTKKAVLWLYAAQQCAKAIENSQPLEISGFDPLWKDGGTETWPVQQIYSRDGIAVSQDLRPTGVTFPIRVCRVNGGEKLDDQSLLDIDVSVEVWAKDLLASGAYVLQRDRVFANGTHRLRFQSSNANPRGCQVIFSFAANSSIGFIDLTFKERPSRECGQGGGSDET